MTTHRTKAGSRELADKIADEHGCEILPTAGPHPALVVQLRYSQGEPLDGSRRARCFTALRAAGISAHGWLS